MENEQKKLVLLATEVMISEEEDKLNPVFLSIKLKLADNAGNRNHEGITAAFISDLVNHQEEYECLPFYADVKNLLARNYDELGHMYNRVTRKFSSTQIGSLTDFYAETDNDGVMSLYATARVPKREQEICLRLAELYELGKLNVSVELSYNPEHTFIKDGVLFIDANEDNALTGLAVVSTPACPDATALDMVASVADDSEEIVAESEERTSERGEDEPMEKEQKLTAEIEEQEVANAETDELTEITAETIDDGNVSETVVAEESKATVDGTAEEAKEDDKETSCAETQEANAEVIEHSVDTHECVDNSGWYGDKPVHVIEYHERIIETMEEAGTVIAELENQIAELTEIKGKYDKMVAEAEAKALAEKQEQAKAFAERQGLDVNETAVAEAIMALDYTKIAELTMAQAQEEKPADEDKAPEITLASFVELDVSEDKYGGLLGRRNN